MLQALYAREVAPELIVGTSVGAVSGAFIASRPQTVQTARELAAIWRGVRRGQVFPFSPLTGLFGFLGSRDHLVPGSGMGRLVRAHSGDRRLEDMPIEFHVLAVDVLTGGELLLSSGPALEAVLASAAIPAVLPPVRWEGRELMDGGVANNTPISQRRHARRARDLRASHGARVRARASAAERAGDGAARVEPVDAQPADSRHRTSP
jgi:NTE family protein